MLAGVFGEGSASGRRAMSSLKLDFGLTVVWWVNDSK
jgi:hypothetical protein